MTAGTTPDRRELLKSAFEAIEQLKAKIKSLESASSEPIAIVGAGCRFPGDANSLDSYWALLRDGRDVVSVIPPERWETFGQSPIETGWNAGLVNGLDQFDPKFFGISAREATTMDPQQRMVLEVGWEALENAGYAPDKMAGSKTGVFLGITGHDYADLLRDAGGLTDVYAATGNANNAAAGRLSFFLGFNGPSVAVDTACSSSLVAVHLACLALKAGDCTMALAGGVNALLTPGPFECFKNWGMMAPDGRCKTFDARADGFVRGEGCGMIILKKLSTAQADGDRILAVIRGSSVNQDGRSSGLTVPNGPAQEAVVRQALAVGQVDPLDVSYVEAHGTGTALGDPIEAHALAAVLGAGRTQDNPLVLGSVKTNLGHLESAAGVAGLLKVVLSLQHERIPAHLHFTGMNPDIDWDDVPVEIPVNGRDWRRGTRARIAGVSSFGFSGTNAHVVLEEAPVTSVPAASGVVSATASASQTATDRPLHILTLSARSESTLDELAQRTAHALSTSDASVADFSYTANTGRAQFRDRIAVIASTREQLRDRLAARQWTAGQAKPNGVRVAALFTGQGSQWAGMGRELYDTQPVFRAALDECASKLPLEHSLLDVLYGDKTALLDQTAYTQPALFALEWSLAQLWKSWGVEPDVVFGHSVGEYAALCVAGVWSLDDGLRLIAERGRMMQALGEGWGMTSVLATRERVVAALGNATDVSIAAVNAPESVVLSGRLEALRTVEDRLKADGITVKQLTVSHGFHSAQMDTMADQFAQLTRSVTTHQPRMRVVSSVTGDFVDAATLGDPQYWRRQVRQPVEFYAAMQTLEGAGYNTFLEVGPTATLAGLGRMCLTNLQHVWVPSLRKDRGAWEQILDSLGTLYVNGAAVQWAGFDAPYTRRRVVLPSYPFQRQRYWLDDAPRPKRASTTGHPFLGMRSEIAGASPVSVWETQVSFETFPYLTDHRVQGDAVVPATAYLEMAIAAGHEMLGDGPIAATNLTFHKPLFLTDAASARVQVSYDASNGSVRVHSRIAPTGPWTLHASGHVSRAEPHDDTVRAPEQLPRTRREMASTDFYAFFEQLGNQWGPTFQGVEHAWIDADEAWGRVTIPAALRGEVGRYYTHPAVADASGHVLAALTAPETADSGGAFVGHSIDRVVVYARPKGTQLLAYAHVTPTDNPHLRRGDVRVFDTDGTLLSDLSGAQLHYLDSAQQEATATASDSWFYQLEWHDVPVATEASSSSAASNWLILTDGERSSQLAAALTVRMQADGAHGNVVSNQSPDALRDALAGHTGATILDLRHVDTSAESSNSSAEADMTTQSAALLTLTQTLASAKPARMWIATQGVQPIGAAAPDASAVRQSPLWGLGRTLSVEHPELYGGLVDLEPNAPVDITADLLWAHLRAADGEDQVTLRNGRRYVARLERYQPHANTANAQSTGRHNTSATSAASRGITALRPDGAYVVTGGLGGLGLAVAEWLVASGARRLVLMGRTPLPPRTQWTTLSAEHPQAKTITTIRALEAAGATVHVASLDVGDARAVNAWYETYTREAWPPIRGIVHAAGVLRHQTLLELTPATLAELMRPKVGAWNLHHTLIDAPLDFFVLFSSASALLSSPKLGAYAAGNAFLDAFAYYRRGLGKPALSIDWGVWGEAGMAAQFDTDSLKTLADRGMGAMRTSQGLDALGRLLTDASASAHVAVLPVNWARWAELFPSYTKAPLLADIFKETTNSTPGASSTSPRAHSVLDASDAERPERLRAYLVTTLGSILGFGAADVDPTLPISSLGLDSLTAVEFKNRIEADLSVSLPTVRFLQGPALVELAAEIEPLLVTIRDTSSTPVISSEVVDVDALSDAEVDAALAELLNGG